MGPVRFSGAPGVDGDERERNTRRKRNAGSDRKGGMEECRVASPFSTVRGACIGPFVDAGRRSPGRLLPESARARENGREEGSASS